jgi:hypothetical protein
MIKKIAEFLIIALILVAGVASAHPPSAIKLTYDSNSCLLQVTVLHDTKKPDEHYIKMVLVRINGKDAVKQAYLKQTDALKRVASYLIEDVKPGDVITATGECNIFGKKTETLKL